MIFLTADIVKLQLYRLANFLVCLITILRTGDIEVILQEHLFHNVELSLVIVGDQAPLLMFGLSLIDINIDFLRPHYLRFVLLIAEHIAL